MTGFMFNIDSGYLEGLCRGFKCGILKQSDYLNLVQCETLEGKFRFFLFFVGRVLVFFFFFALGSLVFVCSGSRDMNFFHRNLHLNELR